jgi:2-polyprenyl-3-methyl-5-hydroxy-6-metoxy-1,4-benzoquinol methylase
MNQKNIKEYIRALEHITSFLKTLLNEENRIVPESKNMLAELTELRMLSKSDVWPDAVPKELICGESEEEKLSRASGIVEEFIGQDLSGLNFLEFGCGEGHVPYVVSEVSNSKLSVGYDIKKQNWDHFEKRENVLFTDSWAVVESKKPFDIILINDVLDHTKNPKEELLRVVGVKTPQTGKIILRVHPWASRHGTHLYKQLNKAYLHLVFSEDELYSMGLENMETIKLLDPISNYKEIIKEAGLTIIKENVTTQPIEMFFTHTPEILRRIKSRWRNSYIPEVASGTIFPRDVLEIQFIDFILI